MTPALPALADAAVLASEYVRLLAERGVAHPVRKGQMLIHEGDRSDTLYIIVRGQLRVYSAHPSNGREITHGLYGPGEYVGEMGLDGGPRSASVEAFEPSVVAVVARPTLEAFIAEYPGFAFELLKKVIGRARAATTKASQLALIDVYGRLKSKLESQAVRQADGSALVQEPLTQRQLAQELGCTREMITRVLKNLETGDYLRRDGRRIVILKPLPPGY